MSKIKLNLPAEWKPISISKIEDTGPVDWIWKGYLAKGGLTLLSGIWKGGKTTLLSLLCKGLTTDEKVVIGTPIRKARTLVVTEEKQGRWYNRHKIHNFGEGELYIISRPFKGVFPSFERWNALLNNLVYYAEHGGLEVVIMDTFASMYPVKSENDAAEIQRALTSFVKLQEKGVAVLLTHHVTKSSTFAAFNSRGSGNIQSPTDTNIFFSYYPKAPRGDRRRVLSAESRDDETPDELVIELSEDKTTYTTLGTVQEADTEAQEGRVSSILPLEPPGLTLEEIMRRTGGKKTRTRDLLNRMVEDETICCSKGGVRGKPKKYWLI